MTTRSADLKAASMSPYCSEPRPGQVGAQFIEQRCRRWLDRLAHVDHGAQRLVIDLDQFQGVFRRAAIARRHGADGFADIADFLHCAGVFIDGPLQARRRIVPA